MQKRVVNREGHLVTVSVSRGHQRQYNGPDLFLARHQHGAEPYSHAYQSCYSTSLAKVRTSLTLTQVRQSLGKISGILAVGPGLQGYGLLAELSIRFQHVVNFSGRRFSRDSQPLVSCLHSVIE